MIMSIGNWLRQSRQLKHRHRSTQTVAGGSSQPSGKDHQQSTRMRRNSSSSSSSGHYFILANLPFISFVFMSGQNVVQSHLFLLTEVIGLLILYIIVLWNPSEERFELLNTIFCLSVLSISTCQYPDVKSKVENHLAPESASTESSIRGRGYECL